MNKKCKICRAKKDLSMFGMFRDAFDRIRYQTTCKECRARILREKRKQQKIQDEFIQRTVDPEEEARDAFKDDPRAAKEVDYGRVVRKPTFVHRGGLID
jgi:hypothetical protein